MKPRAVARIVLILTVATSLTLPAPADAAGPWRATIVDAETGQPLDGVVVVAAFLKDRGTFAGWGGGEYYGSEEAVTGPDGRFEIPARTLWNPIRILSRVRVELTIVKPGFGRARPRLTPDQQARWRERPLAELLEQEGITMDMPRLATREARLEYLSTSGWIVDHRVPPSAIPRFLDARDRERAALGLSTR